MTPKPLFPNLRVSKTERQSLAAMLVSWHVLNAIFLTTRLSATDIKKLLVVEQQGANRPHMLRRLIGRLHTTERANYYKTLNL